MEKAKRVGRNAQTHLHLFNYIELQNFENVVIECVYSSKQL